MSEGKADVVSKNQIMIDWLYSFRLLLSKNSPVNIVLTFDRHLCS
jgi:hypothetical protein